MTAAPSKSQGRPHGSPAFRCRTLGGLALYSREEAAEPLIGAAKPTALLVYLALAPNRRADRDRLGELLWRAADPADARHSLRQAVYRLRTAAGVRLVQARGTDLELSQRVRFDFEDGERALAEEDFERAVRLLRGEFLAGFSISESREFERWAESHRTRLRESWAQAAEALARQELAAGNPSGARELAEELANARPFDDGPVRLLMGALAHMGRHAAALSQYQGYREVLGAELEEGPGEDLERYAGELAEYLKGRSANPADAELPFVGRESEWAVLEAAWGRAQAGDGGAVLVEGAAGSGKSRILAELSARVRAAGGTVLLAKCYEVEQTVPYAAAAEALAEAEAHPGLAAVSPAWLGEAARLLPELGERYADQPVAPHSETGSPASKRRLHQALGKVVEAVADNGGVLLAVDDVHWADPSSLELLHFLSHKFTRAKTLVVCSYRPAELSPATRRFTRSLLSGKLAELVILEPLSQEATAELLGRMATFEDPELARSAAESLHRHSGGNPLFMNELIEALERRRVLWRRGDRWEVASRAEIEHLPRTLGKLLADRVDRLEPWMRACVEVLAVAADATPVELLARLVEISEPRAELALAVLEEERLVKRAGAGAFELVHDELRHLAYQGIPDDRRHGLHELVGRVLEELGEARRPGGTARLAYHFDQAGDAEGARRYALQAAKEAETLASPEARRAHLALADAHAPQALPPGKGGLEETRSRKGRRGLVAASIAALVLLGVWGAWLVSGASETNVATNPADYRQGTLYLASSSVYGATHRLRWPSDPGDLAELETVAVHPEGFPPRLLQLGVTEGGETHSKLFVVHDRDTTQLTFGTADDVRGVWSPDGRFILVARGRRVRDDRYRENLFLLEPDGSVVRQVTDTSWQDRLPTWSPRGDWIAFNRDSAAISSLWIADADGAHATNLTERFSLPDVQGVPAFSPDGGRLAVLYGRGPEEPGLLYMVDLRTETVRFFPLGREPAGGAPLWSPDGGWVAYVVRADTGRELRASPTGDTWAPRRIAGVPAGLLPRVWGDGRSRHVEEVRIAPRRIELRIGAGLSMAAQATTAAGASVEPVLRWSILEPSVARTDDVGFVVGRTAGTTGLVASAGGFRADTVEVSVAYAPVDTLFAEDWSAGIDTIRWVYFGSPRSRVIRDATSERRTVFLNNGDYNHGSGVVSTVSFEPGEDGLTLESEGWANLTGGHWQIWQLGLMPDSESTPEVGAGGLTFSFQGPNPTARLARWSCASGAGGEWNVEPVDSRWFKIALQLRPDGYLECWLDGQLLGRGRMPPEALNRPVAVILRGHSVDTEIYHGPVVLTRGLRY